MKHIGWYVPTSQLMQALASVAPTVGWYVPTPQLMQALCPTVSEYLPWTQLVQKDSPVVEAYLPASQSKQVLWPVGDVFDVVGWNLPTEHKVHTVAPVVSEYLPPLQFWQGAVENIDLNFPLTQLQQVVNAPVPSQSCVPGPHEVCAVATCAREHSRRQASARPAIMPGASNISKAGERPLLATGRYLQLLGQHEATLLVLVQRVLRQLLELAQVLSLLARLRPEPLVVVIADA